MREEIDTALRSKVDFDSWSAQLKEAQAYRTRKDEFTLLRFQLIVVLVISALTLMWGWFAVPGQFDDDFQTYCRGNVAAPDRVTQTAKASKMVARVATIGTTTVSTPTSL